MDPYGVATLRGLPNQVGAICAEVGRHLLDVVGANVQVDVVDRAHFGRNILGTALQEYGLAIGDAHWCTGGAVVAIDGVPTKATARVRTNARRTVTEGMELEHIPSCRGRVNRILRQSGDLSRGPDPAARAGARLNLIREPSGNARR